MTIVTVNTRLARQLRRQYDAEQKAAGLVLWESPEILTWPAWLGRLWENRLFCETDDRVLLSGEQEAVLWETAIRESAAASDLLNVEGAAESAAAAWRLLHDWRLPVQRSLFEGVPDTVAFFDWMTAFRERLSRGGFITAAELAGVVQGRPDFVAGFDELTPAQGGLLEGVAEYPVPAAPFHERWRTGAADELAAAASWAREQLERKPAASVGVVLVNLGAWRAAAERVFEDVLGTRAAFHISVGVPLAEVPLVRSALLALKLCQGMTLAEAGALLRSPFFRHSQAEGARMDLDLRKRKASNVSLALPEFQVRFPMAADTRGRRPIAWSAQFSKLALASGWPGPRALSSEEYQAINSWKELLAKFSRLDAVVGELSFGPALERLQSMAERTRFNVEEQGEPVQVMDVPEAAGSRFDALWIGGMHDGAWPSPVPRNPFLPVAMQRSVEAHYAFAVRTTNRLMKTAPLTVCSYPLHDGEAPLRPSPLIQMVPEIVFEARRAAVWQPLWEQFAEDAGPAFAGGVQKGGTRVIADQSDCPFRAFAKHRLGARGLDEVEPALSLRERGTLMHQALELIWGELKTQSALRSMDAGDVNELVARCVGVALETKLNHRGPRARFLEGARMEKLLREWMLMEAQRPDFETGEVESKRVIAVGGLQVEVRMDRIDRYADGTLALMDYKTGTEDKAKDWEGARPKAPQLPLYSLQMDQPVSSVMFARVAAGKSQLVGISNKDEPGRQVQHIAAMAEQIAEWRVVMEKLAGEFVRGDAKVDPREGAVCNLCDLQGVCRINGLEEGDE